MKRRFTCLMLLNTLFLSLPVFSASHVVILTSFPESFYAPIQTAFEKHAPQTSLRIINKKTPALMAHIEQQRAPVADLIWLSSSDAMAQLELKGHVKKSDTFAWSQFGFFWNSKKLQQLDLPIPTSWETVLQPRFRDHIAMSAPSRSGTNHLVIELLLQQYGWQKGWQYMLQLGGNLSTITARSFGVREGILKERFTVAPVVDFFYRSAVAQGAPVAFHPLPNTPLIPAMIATTDIETPHPTRQKFVEFLLSQAGQALLSLPNVNRIPSQVGFDMHSANQNFAFNSKLSAKRYHTVNAIFDQWVTNRLESLHDFWQLWHQIQQQTLTQQQQLQLTTILQIASHLPVEEQVASDPMLNSRLSPAQRYDDFYPRITQLWQSQMQDQLQLARQQLEQLYQEVQP